MSTIEKINSIEIQISRIRLEIIKTISGINRMLANNPRVCKSPEYLALKTLYNQQKEEIHCLSAFKKDLSVNALYK